MIQNSLALSRTWFLGRGCKQVPLESTGGKILWAHPDGYFLNAHGLKVFHVWGPAMRTPGKHCNNGHRGVVHPNMRHFGNGLCHRLMAYAFSDEPCPTFVGKNGKPYLGIVHHLIEDPLNYRPANLLCWLTREQHAEADRRQRALRKVVPNGDLSVFTYERLRDLQDPRSMSRELFEQELAAIEAQHLKLIDPHARMEYDMTHHCEC